jgi:hypothetical protein
LQFAALTHMIIITFPLTPAIGQTASSPTIYIAATISVEPDSLVSLPIRIRPTASIPRDSFVRLRGLPPMVALSNGYSIAPGSWAVPLQALADLKITLPAAVPEGSRADVSVSLVTADGSVLVEARSTLIVIPSRQAIPLPQPVQAEHSESRLQIAAPSSILPEVRDQAMKLMQKGDEQLAQGLVAPARLLYERAADLGFAPAAMALARTYDSAILAASPHLRGVAPDAKEAERWYERARQLGSTMQPPLHAGKQR